MKGRIVGAIWIIVAFCICFFGWNGEFFNLLFLASFIMATAEICIVAYGERWKMKPKACKPYYAWVLELIILIYAAILMVILDYREVALVALMSIVADVGAFTFGKLFGKHRVRSLRKISPNKTWEGYIGGVLSVWIFAYPVCYLLGIPMKIGTIAYLVVAGLIAELGDILGSATKRQLDVKDSGEVLAKYPIMKWLEFPVKGHGGYLDRVDSISLCMIIYALINIAS